MTNHDHITEPMVLRALDGDATAFDEARRVSFAAWRDDNNEGNQVASLLDYRAYQQREHAILGMGEEDGPIPFTFLDALRRYWG